MHRLTMLVHRAIALGVLCALLAAPTALAQPAPAPEPPHASALIPVQESEPATFLDAAEYGQAASATTAPAETVAPPTLPTTAPQAADEGWDDRFGTPGLPDQVTTLERAPDGTLYAGVGRFSSFVTRWNSRGWQRLAGELNGQVRDLAVSGNTLYAVGDFKQAGTASAKQIAKWSGSTWARVGNGTGPQRVDQFGSSDGDLYAVAVVGNIVYVGGDFNRIDGVEANGIARWNGTTWAALDKGVQNENSFEPQFVSGTVYTIVPDSGKLYVGGRFELAGGSTANSIAIWDGDSWGAFGAGMTDDDDSFDPAGKVLAIAVSNGLVYAGGNFDRAGGQLAENIARWSGSAWSPLGTGVGMPFEDTLDEPVHTIVVSGANVYAGGELESAGDQVAQHLARWNGSAWSAVGGFDDFDTIDDLAAGPGGGIYVGGEFIMAGDRLANNIALWNGADWRTLGLGLTDFATGSNPGEPRAIVSDSAGRIYVGGRFQTAGGIAAHNIAMWDGTQWAALGAGTEGDGGLDDGSVEALVIVGNDLYVGGKFIKAGGASIQHLAKFNLATRQWSQVGGGVDGQVYSLTYSNGLLYVGGDFNNAGSLPVEDIATWDGARWAALGNSVAIYQVFDSCSEQATQVYDIAVQGSLVYVGGNFRLVYKGTGDICSVSSYLLANHLLVYDRAANTWYTLGSGQPGVSGGTKFFAHPISALLALGDDLYVGGHYTKAGAVTASNIARFNLTAGWSAVSGGVSGTHNNGASSTGPEVRTFALSGAHLYVAGDFTATGGGPAENIARYDIAGGTWAPLGSGLAYPNSGVTINALFRAPNGLYIGGKFMEAGGRSSSGLAFWNLGPLPSQNKHVYLPLIKR
jgi:hypothetical protein